MPPPTPGCPSPTGGWPPRSPWSPATAAHAVDRETNWDALAAAGGTIVVLMGVAHRADDRRAGSSPGASRPDTPAVAVTWGTRPEQRTVRTTLGRPGRHRHRAARRHRRRRRRRARPGLVRAPPPLRAPGRGDPGPGPGVAALRPPGRARRRAGRGARHRGRPPPPTAAPALRAAAEPSAAGLRLGGVHLVPRRRAARRRCSATPGRSAPARVAAIGPGTAAALTALRPGRRPGARRGRCRGAARRRFPPARAGPAAPGRRRPRRPAQGLWPPRAGRSRWSRPTGRSRARPDPAALAARPAADAITFTSSSTVTNLDASAVAGAAGAPVRGLHRAGHRRHGPRPPGIPVDAVADEHSIDGLVAALRRGAGRHGPGRPANGADRGRTDLLP